MPTRETYLEQIEKELAAARGAHGEGNEGKARVCARRAAGAALAWFAAAFARTTWGPDAMRLLESAKAEESFPAEVRAAAMRLATKVTERFSYPFASDPVEDAQVIVRHIRERMEGGHAGAH